MQGYMYVGLFLRYKSLQEGFLNINLLVKNTDYLIPPPSLSDLASLGLGYI